MRCGRKTATAGQKRAGKSDNMRTAASMQQADTTTTGLSQEAGNHTHDLMEKRTKANGGIVKPDGMRKKSGQRDCQ